MSVTLSDFADFRSSGLSDYTNFKKTKLWHYQTIPFRMKKIPVQDLE